VPTHRLHLWQHSELLHRGKREKVLRHQLVGKDCQHDVHDELLIGSGHHKNCPSY
jgi:hypothetical protein